MGEANGDSVGPRISGDGLSVAFESLATNLVLFDVNGNLPADDCTGFFAFDMSAFAAGLAGGLPKPELSQVGQQVDVQFWGRQGPTGTYLSTAVQYVVSP